MNDPSALGQRYRGALTFVPLFVHVLGLDEPVHVADHVLLHLLALLRLLQLPTRHRLFSLLGELSVRIEDTREAFASEAEVEVEASRITTHPLNTPRTRLMMKKDPKMTRDTK